MNWTDWKAETVPAKRPGRYDVRSIATEQWEAMRDVAKHLVSLAPLEVGYWICSYSLVTMTFKARSRAALPKVSYALMISLRGKR